MTEIMPVPRNLILLSYQQGAFAVVNQFVFYIDVSISSAYSDMIEIASL